MGGVHPYLGGRGLEEEMPRVDLSPIQHLIVVRSRGGGVVTGGLCVYVRGRRRGILVMVVTTGPSLCPDRCGVE